MRFLSVLIQAKQKGFVYYMSKMDLVKPFGLQALLEVQDVEYSPALVYLLVLIIWRPVSNRLFLFLTPLTPHSPTVWIHLNSTGHEGTLLPNELHTRSPLSLPRLLVVPSCCQPPLEWLSRPQTLCSSAGGEQRKALEKTNKQANPKTHRITVSMCHIHIPFGHIWVFTFTVCFSFFLYFLDLGWFF